MISSRKTWSWLTITGLFFLDALSASANLSQVLPEMDDLEQWTLFSLQAAASSDGLSRHVFEGDAGHGRIRLDEGATIEDAMLDNSVNEAIDVSNDAFALAPTRSYTRINLSGNQSLTLTGAPGETVVLTLRNFVLSGSATFTLQGTATTMFIINVRKHFSLSGNAQIVLSGGLRWDDVLFNVYGKGSAVSLSGNASFQGILMANQRTVKLRGHATVSGEIIANRIVLRGSSSITRPPIVSP